MLLKFGVLTLFCFAELVKNHDTNADFILMFEYRLISQVSRNAVAEIVDF